MIYKVYFFLLFLFVFYAIYKFLFKQNNKKRILKLKTSISKPVIEDYFLSTTPMIQTSNTRFPLSRTLTTQFSMQRPSLTKYPMPQVYIPRQSMPQYSISQPPLPASPNTHPL